MRIGVIGVQGDVSEHVNAIETALKRTGKRGQVVHLRRADELRTIDAITLPGGESTTISKLLAESGLYEPLREKAFQGMPILGTCAGCILLAKDAGEQAKKVKLLELMDMKVERNAFGRQKESFETSLTIEGLQNPFKGVFIRAPAIVKVLGDCRAISRIGEVIVAARQKNLVAAAFHPELADDTSFHEMFVELI